MKKLKALLAEVREKKDLPVNELLPLVWKLICYSPKMPLRQHQEQLLAEASRTNLSVFDPHFAGAELRFPVYRWANGPQTVLLAHGWTSKAADFAELINLLRRETDFSIVAFDAPGNGSAEGELSNLLLFIKAFLAVYRNTGIMGGQAAPLAVIAHSLGAMSAVLSLQQVTPLPEALISLAPMVRLKRNFMASLDAAELRTEVQDAFFEVFESKFKLPATSFDLPENYKLSPAVRHHVFFDRHDEVTPYPYLQELLDAQADILWQEVSGCGHHRILTDASVQGAVLQVLAAIGRQGSGTSGANIHENTGK